jgi:hypothetical protein
MQLLKAGQSPRQIADSLRLSVPRVERYIEEEELARDLDRHRCDHVPVQRIRDLYDQRTEEDPTLNQAKLAREAKIDRADLARALGLAKTAAKTKNGHRQEGAYQTTIGVDIAARIVRALGFAPHEIPGL